MIYRSSTLLDSYNTFFPLHAYFLPTSFRQFWANLAAMAMANNMPSFERKKRKRHNFCKKCQNLASDGLLESPLNFPSTQKVSKNPITNWNCSCMPKIPKFHI
jgi:hypothetical protein